MHIHVRLLNKAEDVIHFNNTKECYFNNNYSSSS